MQDIFFISTNSARNWKYLRLYFLLSMNKMSLQLAGFTYRVNLVDARNRDPYYVKQVLIFYEVGTKYKGTWNAKMKDQNCIKGTVHLSVFFALNLIE